jgi:hypothetical protein
MLEKLNLCEINGQLESHDIKTEKSVIQNQSIGLVNASQWSSIAKFPIFEKKNICKAANGILSKMDLG